MNNAKVKKSEIKQGVIRIEPGGLAMMFHNALQNAKVNAVSLFYSLFLSILRMGQQSSVTTDDNELNFKRNFFRRGVCYLFCPTVLNSLQHWKKV
ncbi:hypothetical protein [Marinobacter sp. CA1]|uniref:hypothetical protein n=1 Tax=Marinobacter sp. CA1 TaxID=2817656 RepID=UPI001D08572D|nr:hypothetical protein [Marinobacter sp. CA1]UDL07040.1 hypothetical protein J2887_09950 [Marinobacter sp. CA1]